MSEENTNKKSKQTDDNNHQLLRFKYFNNLTFNQKQLSTKENNNTFTFEQLQRNTKKRTFEEMNEE